MQFSSCQVTIGYTADPAAIVHDNFDPCPLLRFPTLHGACNRQMSLLDINHISYQAGTARIIDAFLR